MLGLVENMAYLNCPHCHERIQPFGPPRVGRIAEEYGVPLLAELPLDPEVSTLGDAGKLAEYEGTAAHEFGKNFLSAMDSVKAGQLTVL